MQRKLLPRSSRSIYVLCLNSLRRDSLQGVDQRYDYAHRVGVAADRISLTGTEKKMSFPPHSLWTLPVVKLSFVVVR